MLNIRNCYYFDMVVDGNTLNKIAGLLGYILCIVYRIHSRFVYPEGSN